MSYVNENPAGPNLLVYPGHPDPLLDQFTADLWSGQAFRGVQTFLKCQPSLEQILAAEDVKHDLFPLRVELKDFTRKITLLEDNNALWGMNYGIALESVSLCQNPQWLPPTEANWGSDFYVQSNAVRAYARVKRTTEAAAVLKDLSPTIDDLSYSCLVGDILFACNNFSAVILELEPIRDQKPRQIFPGNKNI
jgi:hypothetical protein